MAITRKKIISQSSPSPVAGGTTITHHGRRSSSNAPSIEVGDYAGYFTIGDMIIQYGSYDTTGTSGTARFTSNYVFDVYFPKTFPSKCCVVVASTCEFNPDQTGSNGPEIVATIEGWDRSKFRIMGDYVNGNLVRASGFSWIAIGY